MLRDVVTVVMRLIGLIPIRYCCVDAVIQVCWLSGVKNTSDCDDVGPLDGVLLPCHFLPVLPSTNTGTLPTEIYFRETFLSF